MTFLVFYLLSYHKNVYNVSYLTGLKCIKIYEFPENFQPIEDMITELSTKVKENFRRVCPAKSGKFAFKYSGFFSKRVMILKEDAFFQMRHVLKTGRFSKIVS